MTSVRRSSWSVRTRFAVDLDGRPRETRSGSPTSRRRPRRHRPGPGGTSSPARPSRPGACRRRPRPGRRGWPATIACRTASISSRTTSTCLQRAPSAMRLPRRPRRPAPAVSPRSRPRSRSSSRTMTTSKCWAATSPELAHVLVAAVAGGGDDADPRRLAELAAGVRRLADPVDEVAERLHAGRVVAVVDDHVDAVDLDLVEAAGGEVVVRREGAQALPDVVQGRTGGERGRGRGQRVLHVHPGPAAERRRQQVGPGQLHLAPAVHHARSSRRARTAPGRRALPPRRQWASIISRLVPGSPCENQTTWPEQRAAHLRHQRVVGVEHRVRRRAAPPRRPPP